MSMTAAGVPYSRAILAARGVVILDLSLACWPQNPVSALRKALGLFDLFTQHFEFQPLVFRFLQSPLRFGKCIRGLVEFLAIVVEQVGVVKPMLLFGDFCL